MNARTFTDEEEGLEALAEAGEGYVLEPCKWRLRLHSWDEIQELNELDEQEVTVSLMSFQTRVDLMEAEMTDEDWISFGKFVAEVARDTRRRL